MMADKQGLITFSEIIRHSRLNSRLTVNAAGYFPQTGASAGETQCPCCWSDWFLFGLSQRHSINTFSSEPLHRFFLSLFVCVNASVQLCCWKVLLECIHWRIRSLSVALVFAAYVLLGWLGGWVFCVWWQWWFWVYIEHSVPRYTQHCDFICAGRRTSRVLLTHAPSASPRCLSPLSQLSSPTGLVSIINTFL